MPDENVKTEMDGSPEKVLSNFTTRLAELGAPAKPAEPETPPEDAPPPAQPAAKPDGKPADTEPGKVADPAPDKWPRKAEDWKKFTEARDKGFRERDEKIAAMQKQIEEIAAKAADATTSKELEALRKERDELSEKIAMLNVVEHPKFKAYYEGKRNEQIAVAKRLLGDRAAQFETIANMPEGQWKEDQLADLVADMNPIQQARVGAIANELARIDAERQSQVENWKQNREAMQAEERKQQETAKERQTRAQKELTEEFEKQLLILQDKEKGMPAFQKRGDAEWDAAVENRLGVARKLFSGQVNKEEAFHAIVRAAAFDGVLTQAISLNKEVERLNEVIKSMTASNPDVKTGGGASDIGEMAISAGMRPEDVMKAFASNVERRRRQG